jgi:hypothetical protein
MRLAGLKCSLVLLIEMISSPKLKAVCLRTMSWRCIERAELKSHTFLTSTLCEGEWSGSHFGYFTSGGGVLVSIHMEAGCDPEWCNSEQKDLFLYWELNPGHPIHS